MLDVQNVNGGRGPKIYSGTGFSYFVDVTLLLLLTQSLNKKNLLSDRIQSTLWEDHNKSLHKIVLIVWGKCVRELNVWQSSGVVHPPPPRGKSVGGVGHKQTVLKYKA